MTSPWTCRLSALLLTCAAAGSGRPADADPGTHSEQSPIDIVTADVVWQPTWPTIGFGYQSSADVTVLNVDAPSVDGSIRVIPTTPSILQFESITYDLLQFHFHLTAEHAIDGKRAPMEMHFVNRKRGSSGNADLLIVGRFIEAGPEDNPLLDSVFSRLPTIPAADDSFTLTGFDIGGLLPEDQRVYRYTGSLTTPPYTEHEQWNIFAGTALLLSQRQIDAFAALFPDGNAREVQPLDGRVVSLVPEPSSFGVAAALCGALVAWLEGRRKAGR